MSESTALSTETASASDWVATLRASQERLVALASTVDEGVLVGPSYDTEWTVAQVFSHLGSSAEIFTHYFEAGANGTEVPGSDAAHPIWDAWNARTPLQQRDDSLVANETLVARIEALSPAEAEAFQLNLFGMDLDLAGFVRMRLSEHAVHTWDIAVAVDPTATLTPDVVDLLIDGVGQTAGWSGKPSSQPYTVRVDTVAPARAFLIAVGDAVTLETIEGDAAADGQIALPAEALFRLVYGRLDPDHTPPVNETGSRGLSDLRLAFQGF